MESFSSNLKATIAPVAFFVIPTSRSTVTGMAVGVENHYNDITGILVAIISHKFFSAFALGVSLVKAGIPSRRTIQLAASFAASTPSGIVIGILMTQALVC